MKTAVILINIVSGVCILAWIWLILISGYVNINGRINPQKGAEDFFITTLATVLVLSLILSHTAPQKYRIFIALAPIVCLIIAMSVLSQLRLRTLHGNTFSQKNKQESVGAVLATMKRDYMCTLSPTKDIGTTDMFITVVPKILTMTYTMAKEGGATLETNPIGKIKGSTLQVVEEYMLNKDAFRQCTDSNGKTIHENYTLEYVPNQNMDEYNLEKWNILSTPVPR